MISANPLTEVDVGTARILVVDDEEDIVRIFRQFLEEQGYTVECSFNGREACERIRTGPYDLVITDMVMSPVRGEQVLETIAVHSPETAAIVVTGHATVGRVQTAAKHHVHDFVEKPVNLHELLDVVRRAVEKSRQDRVRKKNLSHLKERNLLLIEQVNEVTNALDTRSTQDSLTGLPGYQYFRSVTESEVSRAIQTRTQVSLGMLDVDHFAEYNQGLGPEAGNTLLVRVADFLAERLRRRDSLFRYGGDEFAVLLADVTLGQAQDCMSRLVGEIAAQNWPGVNGSASRSVTLSGGVACVPDNAVDFDELVCHADHALALAKKNGRNRVERA